jgi:hypothetical protein
MPTLKPPKRLTDLIRSYQTLKRDADDSKNACNRKKTELKNEVVGYLRDQGLPAGTVVLVDGYEYAYSTTESTYIDPEKWFRMFQAGRITEREFLEALSVGKAEAKRIIGQDQVETLSVTEKGTNADIRIRENIDDYDHPHNEPVVIVPEVKAKPVRKVVRQIANVTTPPKPKLKRLVRL